MRFALRLAALAVSGWLVLGPPARAAGWKAGTGRAAITPREPLWMAGYASRDHPSEGAVHDLWAKTLGLEDPSGRRALVVTLDVCGIDGTLSGRLRDAFKADLGLDRDRVVIACSHTHSGPVLGSNLLTMYPIDDEQKRKIVAYTATFERQVREAAAAAFARMEPVDLAWDTGRADFAVNRRNNKEGQVSDLRKKFALEGPVDHDVPVLRIRGADGKPRAVVFGYACHCTVLSFYKFCGDYAGFAQADLESSYPGAQAMFFAGCGADQNPLPRRTVELAESYGRQLAAAVRLVLDRSMRPVAGPLVSAYEEIDLRFGTLPTREQLEEDSRSKNGSLARRARKLIQTLDHDGRLPQSYPYPVQVWRLGDLNWVLLGGEVVVDYSLRLKRNLGASHTWVSSYCNDVMAYIPSLRVLKEGGYEGETSMIPYGQPTKWSQDVESQIIDAAIRLEQATQPKP